MAVSCRGYLFQVGFLIFFTPGIVTLLDTVGFTARYILHHYPGVSCAKATAGQKHHPKVALPKSERLRHLPTRWCQELQSQSPNTQSQSLPKKLDNN